MGKTVAIVQSNYIPWRGYFDLIRQADEFVLFDDVQYTRRDWRNRNCIKTANGVHWLTIPVHAKGKFLQKIRDTRISDPDWGRVHWRTIASNYARAPFFADVRTLLEELYRSPPSDFLSEVNRAFLERLCVTLGIRTRLTGSNDYAVDVDEPTQRLLELCRKAGATTYLSGPAARSYLDVERFETAGIAVRWMDYQGYPDYPQLHGPFVPAVSVIDLLCMTGPGAAAYLERQAQAA